MRDVACRADGGGHVRIVHERPGGDRLQGIGEKPRQRGAGSEEGQAGAQEWNSACDSYPQPPNPVPLSS